MLPWRPERPFQTEGKINTLGLDLTPTKPRWPHLLASEALVFSRNFQWPLLQVPSTSRAEWLLGPGSVPGAT